MKPIAVIFVAYLILAAVLPAADDEVYYWCWSKDLQWSYYDHPPMTAVLVRLSTSLFGDTVFGLRFPACVASAFVLFVINRLTPNPFLIWGIALSPLFTFGAILMTPDSPLLMFWSAYLWWLVELHRRLTPISDDSGITNRSVSVADWLVGGILLGCGVLSKYTMGLAVPAALISLLVAGRPWRDWIRGYVFHGIVAFVVASPILIYNMGQNFEPLLFQWRHAAQQTPNALRSIVEFVGVQLLLFGTLPFFLFPWVIANFRSLCKDARLRVCTSLYIFPLAFFLYKSTKSHLEGNWALVCFISFWPLAAVWFESVRASRFWRWSTVSAFLPPTIAVLIIAVHWIWPLSFVPVKADRLHRQIALNAATREVARQIRDRGESLPVYTDSYQMTSLLRFQSLPAQQIDGLTRPSYFTRPPRRLTDVGRAYVVTENPLPQEYAVGFGSPELVGSVPVEVRDTTISHLNIRLYSKPSFLRE